MATTGYGRSVSSSPDWASALRSPALAALLSFVVPGLGQALAGRYRRAFLFFLPIVAIVLGAVLLRGRGIFAVLTNADALVAIWWGNLVAFGYHVAAVVDAYVVAAQRPAFETISRRYSVRDLPGSPRSLDFRARRRTERGDVARAVGGAALVLALVFTSIVHVYAAADISGAQTAINNVFNPLTPWSSATTGANGETAAPAPTPNRDWALDGKLNVLLIGIDRGPGGARASGLRPDTMILLQVDIKSGRAAMYGIPRNLVNVPLPPAVASHYPCRCWNDLLDYFWQEAADTHAAWYTPAYGGDRYVRGIKALEAAIGYLTGVQMDGAVLIDLIGFIKLVDAFGGIDINVPKELRDTQYPILEHGGTMTIDIKAGLQHMNGTVALEYARSRHSTDDYDRMRRQQLVLRAIRDKIAHPCSLLPQIPAIEQTIAQNFWTDLPSNAAPDLLALAEKVGNANTAGYTLVPASFARSSTDVNIPEFLDATSIAKVRDLVAHGLDKMPSGNGSSSPSPSAGGGGGFGFNLSC